MKPLIFILLLAGCSSRVTVNEDSEYGMTCIEVDHLVLKRCENNEVVCYTAYKQGISCKFKTEQER